MQRIFLLSALVVGACVGCTESAEVVEPAKPVIAFEGERDPKVVGTWTTNDKKSVYRFGEDGSFNLRAKRSTPGGVMDSNINGQWLVKDGRFLLKDEIGNVIPYSLKVEGKRLTLTSVGSLKNQTVLNRQ